MLQKLNTIVGLDLLFCVKVSDFKFRSSNKAIFNVVRTYTSNEIPASPEDTLLSDLAGTSDSSNNRSPEILKIKQPATETCTPTKPDKISPLAKVSFLTCSFADTATASCSCLMPLSLCLLPYVIDISNMLHFIL